MRLRPETDPDFRPLLLVPRQRLHDSGLDVKGPHRSVSMAVWLIRESGTTRSRVSGTKVPIWHPGPEPASRVELGKRQYALFRRSRREQRAAAAHVSENGGSSFGDRCARNLAVTPEVIRAVPGDVAASNPGRRLECCRLRFR